MNGRRALALVLLSIALSIPLANTSCGGGPSGTARSTVQGNLSDVEQAGHFGPSPAPRSLLARVLRFTSPVASAWAQSILEGVRVTIEGTPFGTVTDAGGSFVIESPFSGPGALVFERDGDVLVGRIGIDVPAGGTVTLRNVRCSRSQGSCGAEEIEVEAPSVELEPSSPSAPSEPSPADLSSIEGAEPSDAVPSEPSPVESLSPSPPDDEHPLD